MAKKKKSNGKGSRIIFTVFVVLAAIVVLLFIFRNHPAIYPYYSKLWSEKLSVLDSGKFQSDNVTEVVMCSEKLTYYDTDTLFNEDGWSYKLKVNSPKLLSSGSSFIVQSIQDGKCSVFSGFKHLYTIEDKNGIILSDVSDSGSCVIASKEAGYRCKVTVYNKKGEDVFRAYFGDRYLTDAALSPDGKRLALTFLDISGDDIKSNVEFYKITEKEPYSKQVDTEAVFVSVGFLKDGTAIAVGDKKAMGFKSSGDADWQYSYNGAVMQYFSYGDNRLLLCLKMGDQQLVTLDSDGNNYSCYHDEADIKYMDVNEDAIMAVTPRKVIFYTVRGYKIAEEDVASDINSIHMPSTGRCGVLVHNFGYEMLEAE